MTFSASAGASQFPPSLTERVAVRIMRRQPKIPAVAPPDDPVHLLTSEERSVLSAISRRTMVRAASAGALSALASSGAAILAQARFPSSGFDLSSPNALRYWGLVLSVTVVASVLEIGFLYWDALRAVHQMACAAGYRLEGDGREQHELHVLGVLARAALELPNPFRPLLGIDPCRESSALFIVLASVLYKAKVALTTFVTKALLKGALGRAAARAVLELVAVPITALWNVAVCHRTLREARLRILGPSAVVELLEVAIRPGELSESAWQVAVRAVASSVVCTRDFHPNHLALLRALGEHTAIDQVREPDDTREFLRELLPLPRHAQTFVLRVLLSAAILDGRITRAERRLLERAFAVCNRSLRRESLDDAAQRFCSGEPVADSIVTTVG